MTVGISVTDIAAKVSIDTSEFFRGMKLVENRVADFTASRAKAFELELPDIQKLIAENPAKFLQQQFPVIDEENYKAVGKQFSDAILQNVDAARAEAQKIIDDKIAWFQQQGYMQDQGFAHVESMKAQPAILRQQLADEMARRNEQELIRLRAHNVDRLREQRAAAEEESQIRAQADYEAYKQSLAAEERFGAVRKHMAERNAEEMIMASLRREQQAIIANTKATADAETEIIQRSTALREDILARHGIETDKRRKIAKRESEERLETERKIEQTLGVQKARYDEVYAFELKQKASRSEFAKLLREAKAQGVSNENLTAVATEFKLGQQREKQAFEAARTLKITDAQKQAQREVLSVLVKHGNKQAEIRLLQVRQREEEEKFRESLDKSNASVAQKQARLKDLRAGQKKQMDELINPSDGSAVRDAREAENIIHRLKSAQELHNERVATYHRLLTTVNVETGRTYLTTKQFNAAVKESERVMRASASGAGAYTGMLAQASFAAEDFIQGIAMGDLRSALLGASNNLTMVARGALQAGQGITVLGMGIKSFIGIIVGIPAAVIGAVAAFSYLNRAERDVRDLATALRDAERGFDLLQDRMNFRQQAGRERQRIDDIEILTQAQKEYQNVLRQQKDAEEQLAAARAKESRIRSETLINTLGGQAAYAEMQDFIARLRGDTREEGVRLGNEMAKAMSTAMAAAKAGEVEKMIDAMRLLNQLSNSAQSKTFLGTADPGSLLYQLNLLLNDPTAQDSLEAIFNTGFWQQTEDQDKLRQIRESMLETTKEIARVENELKQATANRKQLEGQIEKLKADGVRLSNEEFKEKQRIAEQERQQNAAAIANEARLLEEKRKRALFDMTATDRQKEMLRIQEQMFEFMGPAGIVQGFAPPGVLGAPEMLAQLQQEGKAAGMQFLQAQATLLEKEIEALQQASSPEIMGGMQQNALQAQADAFKQMFATVNKQNPQLTLLAQKLDAVKKAIENGNVFQLVGQ